MVEEESRLYLVVYLDHLDERVFATPFLEMLFLHCLVDDLAADLALGGVPVALDRVCDHLLVRKQLPAVWALHIRHLRHFLGVFEVLGLLAYRAAIEPAA